MTGRQRKQSYQQRRVRRMPLAISDAELELTKNAARTLKVEDRDLLRARALGLELSQYPQLGPGLINRVARNLQRQFFATHRI
jgi:hypothetical protein